MIRYEDECVGPCPQGCMGSSCRYRHVPHFYCDHCGADVGVEDIREDGISGGHICTDCLEELYPKISL